jgi:hypothetical protein
VRREARIRCGKDRDVTRMAWNDSVAARRRIRGVIGLLAAQGPPVKEDPFGFAVLLLFVVVLFGGLLLLGRRR